MALSTTVVVVVFGVLMGRGHFRVRMTPDMAAQIPLIALSVASGATATMLLTALPVLGQPSPAQFASLLGCLVVAAIAAQLVGIYLVRALWTKGLLRSAALIYGSDALAQELAVEIGLRQQYGVDVRGFLAEAETADASLTVPVYDVGSSLAVAIARSGADRLIIGPGLAGCDADAIRIARFAASNGLAVWVVPRFYEMGLGVDSMSPDRVRGYPLVRLQKSVHPQISIRLKRIFDVAVAGAVLLAALPLMLVTAILIKVTSPGPVFFAQERVGQHGHPIVIRKFRSMRSSSTSDAEWTADDRVTWIGRWIRRLNIDELPQLWAVVCSDMSLVGPRPERPVFVDRFRHEIADYDDRHRMLVGMTGLAQIEGLRGDTSIAERVKYDNLYIDQWSFRSDLKILVKTIVAVVRQRSNERHVIELEEALQGQIVPPSPAVSPPTASHRSP